MEKIYGIFFQFQKSTLPFGMYRLCFKVQMYVLVEQVSSILYLLQ